jgi:hypothetical protein
VITAAATLVLERALLREVAGYLRPARAGSDGKSLAGSSA